MSILAGLVHFLGGGARQYLENRRYRDEQTEKELERSLRERALDMEDEQLALRRRDLESQLPGREAQTQSLRAEQEFLNQPVGGGKNIRLDLLGNEVELPGTMRSLHGFRDIIEGEEGRAARSTEGRLERQGRRDLQTQEQGFKTSNPEFFTTRSGQGSDGESLRARALKEILDFSAKGYGEKEQDRMFNFALERTNKLMPGMFGDEEGVISSGDLNTSKMIEELGLHDNQEDAVAEWEEFKSNHPKEAAVVNENAIDAFLIKLPKKGKVKKGGRVNSMSQK